MLPDEGFQVIVAVALLSITVNPALFALTPDAQTRSMESALRS